MATFTVNKDVNATVGPFSVAAIAGSTQSCPDDLFSELEATLEATPGVVVTLLGYDRDTGTVDVLLYGAKGDGVTDDTAAIDRAIAAMPGGGTLYFREGEYVTSGGHTLPVNCTVKGAGSGGSGATAQSTATSFVSRITCSSGTDVLFTVTADIARFEKLSLHNSHATPTAGSAIKVAGTKGNQRVDYEGVVVSGFWIGVDVQVGVGWSMHGCTIARSRKYALKIQNTLWVDNADFSISDCQFVNFPEDAYTADAGVRIESGGGGRISNSRIHGYGFSAGDAGFVVGLDLAVGPGIVTGELYVSNTQITGMSSHGFRGSYQNASSYWQKVVFTGCLFATFDVSLTTVPSVSVSWTGSGSKWDFVNFVGCEFHNATAPTVAAIVLSGVRHAILAAPEIRGYVNFYTADAACEDVRLITHGGDPFIGPVDPRIGGAAGGTHTAVNRALVSYFTVNAPHIVTAAYFQVATQSGSVDIGIYSSIARLGSTGSVACPAAGITSLSFTAPIQLWPGIVYGIAVACDNTTVSFVRHTGNTIMPGTLAYGGFFAESAFPLPATLTAAGVNAIMPVVTLG